MKTISKSKQVKGWKFRDTSPIGVTEIRTTVSTRYARTAKQAQELIEERGWLHTDLIGNVYCEEGEAPPEFVKFDNYRFRVHYKNSPNDGEMTFVSTSVATAQKKLEEKDWIVEKYLGSEPYNY